MKPEEPSPKGSTLRETLSQRVSGGWVLRELVALAGLWLAIDADSVALKVLGALVLVVMVYPDLNAAVRTVKGWDWESDRQRKASKPPDE